MVTRLLTVAMIVVSIAATSHAQPATEDGVDGVRKELQEYVRVFNQRDPFAIAPFWTNDAVSVQEETGERSEGRDAILADFKQFFSDYPQAQLSGSVEHVRKLGADVAIAEGRLTLVTGDGQPSQSAYTAVLQRENNRWLIASSSERDLPMPATSYDALQELAWMVGGWEDQTGDASVFTTVRWSPNRAFLIRSYSAQFEEDGSFTGTQIFGWDAVSKQIRTWTFNSDGSFGDGAVSKNGQDWMIKMNQFQTDGRLASGVSVVTRLDDNTIQVQKIGESVNGEPVPASEPVTVVRIAGGTDSSTAQPLEAEGVGR